MKGHRRTAPPPNDGTYIGTVTKVEGAYAFVQIKRLVDGYEYGPAGYPSEYAQDGDAPLTVGDKVAVGFIEAGRDNCVVLLRFA